MSSRTLERSAIVGLVASVLLALGKLVAGFLGHSSALIADGVESMADSVGSIMVLHGLRVARRPPDRDHPYGYGRAETLAALGVGGLLVVAAAFIVVKAFMEILTPHQAPAPWTLLVLVAVIAVKEILFRVVLRSALAFESAAAKADAWHHRSDAITSAAALIGVSIAIWGPGLLGAPRLVLADEVAAILASGVILLTAVHLLRPAVRELLDASASDLADAIRGVASKVEGVRLVEKVTARRSGRGVLVDMHLHVDPALDVRSAHALAGRVKARVREAHPAVVHVLIHVEPDERDPVDRQASSAPMPADAAPAGDRAGPVRDARTR